MAKPRLVIRVRWSAAFSRAGRRVLMKSLYLARKTSKSARPWLTSASSMVWPSPIRWIVGAAHWVYQASAAISASCIFGTAEASGRTFTS